MEKALFRVETKDKAARCGVIKTKRGKINTPAFMPVATLGDIKTLPIWDIKKLEIQIFITNTYHLYIRPGEEIIDKLGGLHSFIGWDGPIAIDSGGFQIYSLSPKIKIQEDGILFSSFVDGTTLRFTPEKVIDLEVKFGADLLLPLDECVGYPIGRGYAKEAMERTNRWAEKSLFHFRTLDSQALLFGIVQGSTYLDLRKEAAYFLRELDFDGYAIGGLVVGEAEEQTREVISATVPILPEEKPRYVMGVGKVEDILWAVGEGVDLFDCVIPTRNARTGTVYTWEGKINLKNSLFKDDSAPISEGCKCLTCLHYSKAYLRHLFNTEELLGKYLATLHNISFYMELMKKIREKITQGTFFGWRDEVLSNFKGGFDDESN
ncbi:MAG: tRNA guanosine(34) transglycosylase Tgt [candidate division WOR-3 bacterium]